MLENFDSLVFSLEKPATLFLNIIASMLILYSDCAKKTKQNESVKCKRKLCTEPYMWAIPAFIGIRYGIVD